MIIGAVLGVIPEVLIDGIITHHQLAPSNEPGKSTLTVTGSDVSVMLDMEEKNEKYENQPDFVIFTRLIAAYAQFGLVPQPTPTADVPIMLQRIPRQQETDLKFIQRMAKRNGYVFYVEPVTFGVNTAYFGPEKPAQHPATSPHAKHGAIDQLRFVELRAGRAGSGRDERHVHGSDFQDHDSRAVAAIVEGAPAVDVPCAGSAHRPAARYLEPGPGASRHDGRRRRDQRARRGDWSGLGRHRAL